MTQAGIPITSWGDMYRLTGPFTLTGPESIPNEAQNRSYMTSWWLNYESDNVQGGPYIQDFPMIETGSTAQNTLPGGERSILDPNVTAQITQQWRLTEDHMTLNDIIMALNGGDNGYDTFKRLMTVKERRLATSYNNKFDADLAAQPNVTLQEGTGAAAVDPMPLWTVLNEYGADGAIFDSAGFPSASGLPNGFSTICGRDPAVDKWYRTWQIPYSDSISTSTVNPGASNLLTAFVKAIELCQWKQMPWKPGESTENNPIHNPEYCVPVSINGKALIQKYMTASQNFFRMDAQDPFYPSPRYAGIPFVSWAAMDQLKIYPTSGTTAPTVGAGVTEMNADLAGPRFPFVSKKQIRWFFHSKFKFYMRPARYPAKQWDSEIHPISTLHNRLCLSRRKLAYVYPSSDITV